MQVLYNPTTQFWTCASAASSEALLRPNSQSWNALIGGAVAVPGFSASSDHPTHYEENCTSTALGVVLPSAISESCEISCGAGERFSPEAEQCAACAIGTFSDSFGPECSACPVGSVAYRTQHLSTFLSWPTAETFSLTPSLCTGAECREGEGFRLISSAIDSGVYTGADVYSLLRITVQVSATDQAGNQQSRLVLQLQASTAWSCHTGSIQLLIGSKIVHPKSCTGPVIVSTAQPFICHRCHCEHSTAIHLPSLSL